VSVAVKTIAGPSPPEEIDRDEVRSFAGPRLSRQKRMVILMKAILGAAAGSLVAGTMACSMAAAPQAGGSSSGPGTGESPHVRNVVLVHGAFVDGSGWERVHAILTKDGYHVSIVQNPTTSLKDDVDATRRVLAEQDGPTILVGHSYGGVVITEAGNDPRVRGLVYVAAFAPDAGESVSALIKDPIPGAPAAPILPPRDGFVLLDKAKFAEAFAADLDPSVAAFRASSQLPCGVAALEGVISHPAWRDKRSWYVLTTEDRMIPPPAQHAMSKRAGATVIEVKASHAVYESQPNAVASAIVVASRGAR
jgi:pimeloyl-ACP methyl ester carboxylesterase